MELPVKIFAVKMEQVGYILASYYLQFHSGKVRVVNTEFVPESQYCPTSPSGNLISLTIYQINYCPRKVTTVEDLRLYPVCCLHPAVWRNVDGVKEKCCSEYTFCV